MEEHRIIVVILILSAYWHLAIGVVVMTICHYILKVKRRINNEDWVILSEELIPDLYMHLMWYWSGAFIVAAIGERVITKKVIAKITAPFARQLFSAIRI